MAEFLLILQPNNMTMKKYLIIPAILLSIGSVQSAGMTPAPQAHQQTHAQAHAAEQKDERPVVKKVLFIGDR